MVKRPNWWEENQLAILQCGGGIELGTTENKSSEWSRQHLNWRPLNYKSSAVNVQPRCLLLINTGCPLGSVIINGSVFAEEWMVL